MPSQKRIEPLFVTALLLAAPVTALSQGTRADYERAGRLRETTRGGVFNSRVDPHWFAESTRFWYRRDLPEGRREYVLVDAVGGEKRAAFDHERLSRALGDATGETIARDRLPIDWLELDAGSADEGRDAPASFRFNAGGKGWHCDIATYDLREIEPLDQPRPRPTRRGRRRSSRGPRESSSRDPSSPDGKWMASIKDHDLHVRLKETGEEFAFTTDGTEDHFYGPPFLWSPDSKKLVAMRSRKEETHTVHFVESSPRDQVQPKLHSRQYLKPGDRVAVSKPHLFDVASRKEIPTSDELYSNPWRIRDVRWQPDSRRFTFRHNQRGHQVLRIVAIDAETGEAGALVDERSETFIDYAHKSFTSYLDDTNEIIWMSERDGWNHLYLYDSRTGAVKNQITTGRWVVRGVDRVDRDKRQVFFRAGGVYPEQDPYYIHHCRIDLDGSNLVLLTAGNGTHEISYSPDGRFLLDTYSRVDQPPITELRRSEDGKLVCELERADWSKLLETGWQVPERFVAKGRDGKTDIYGVIFRPTAFDAGTAPESGPERRYPVIEKIYAGPQGSFVPKSFRPYHSSQAMAELGFVVVQIDGMGTSNRSKAFHDVCWRNLKDAGFPDRILWIQAAAKKYPYLDPTRVGIYGGSAGGQNALGGLLLHGDFYKVGVADCGCHDNRMDKVWWNELWMGWPVGDHYADNSNVTHAHKLEGKLLLTVGELDRNVDPASTMQVVDALIRAEKDFDFLLVPGAGHGVGDSSPYARRRRSDFFVRHLLGVEPRREPAATATGAP